MIPPLNLRYLFSRY